jgi:hypothetical protein
MGVKGQFFFNCGNVAQLQPRRSWQDIGIDLQTSMRSSVVSSRFCVIYYSSCLRHVHALFAVFRNDGNSKEYVIVFDCAGLWAAMATGFWQPGS